MLSEERFLEVVSSTPLVAVDLVLIRGGREILLGLRNNRPAQGFWFVPGGRILKNEPIKAALERVARTELGLRLADLPQAPSPMGAFEHFYPDCFSGEEGVSTHYVAMGYLLKLHRDFSVAGADGQHAATRWWPLAEVLAAEMVHRFTKDYVMSLFDLNISR